MNNHKEFVLSKQLLRSGSSIGANIEESQFAQSKADFISKLSIALKEASESRYWIRLLTDTHYMNQEKKVELMKLLNEIISMLVSSINTTKANLES